MNENHPIYGNEEYKLIADQIEDHQLATRRLMKELEEKFPSGELKLWCIMGDNRPYMIVDNRIED